LVELHGVHMNTTALTPPALTGGMLATSHMAVAHFSQSGGAVGDPSICQSYRRTTVKSAQNRSLEL
jgi:hypothetical protein